MSEETVKKIIYRPGKTRRDHVSGAHTRNRENKLNRVAWQDLKREGKRSQNNFPYSSCNGKRNRSRITGKGGKQIVRSWKGMM